LVDWQFLPKVMTHFVDGPNILFCFSVQNYTVSMFDVRYLLTNFFIASLINLRPLSLFSTIKSLPNWFLTALDCLNFEDFAFILDWIDKSIFWCIIFEKDNVIYYMQLEMIRRHLNAQIHLYNLGAFHLDTVRLTTVIHSYWCLEFFY